MRSSLAGVVVAVVAGFVLIGCPRPPEETPILEIVPDDAWPVLADDLDAESLEAACEPSIGYLRRLPADQTISFGSRTRTAAELAAGVERACEIATMPEDRRDVLLRQEFLLLKSTGRDGLGEVLFTGYYEPLLEARPIAGGGFEHPVYGVPNDLITIDLETFGLDTDPARLIGRVDGRRLVPYHERELIDFGDGLRSDTEILGYVDDPVDLFFLHVQGSGTLVFPDGRRTRAGYAQTNGRPYRSIGKLLIDDGLVPRDEMSMQAIRAYLEDHPEELRRVLGYNPSYVFFRPLPSDGGPLGCYGEPVTGGRSIATDRRLFPAPVMAWIRAEVPAGGGGEESIARFVLNQDTGGSIRGPGRVDLFFGQGHDAGELAGRTNHTGELYFLLPKRAASESGLD